MAAGKDAPKVSETQIAAMDACVVHARALVQSARAVQASSHPNIAYHLAALALEEIGRRALIGVQSIADQELVPPAWPKKHEQDHIKKLFWCFFGGGFFSEAITAEGLKEMSDLAKTIHETRLGGLYVDSNEDRLSIPGDAISADQAETLLKLAEARLGMAESETVRAEVPAEELEMRSWFLRAADDPEKRKQIFSGKSLAKLAELKDTKAWAQWLKDLYDKARAESKEAVQRELERSRNLPDASTKDKWKVRIRIISASHSIRPRTLSAFNAVSNWIKLSAVNGKKNELLIDFILGDNLPVEALWYFAWGLARQFVVALNIGSMGFFWWRMPEQISRYYESIQDLETGGMLALERTPSLRIDWGENRVLTDQDIARVAACFSTLAGPEDSVARRALDLYIGGLTFLSLNDVHWQCELQSFGNFLQSLKAMMEQHGDLKEGEPFEPAFVRFLDSLFPDIEEKQRFVELCHAFEANDLTNVKITLKEVSFIKLFCDAYYLRKMKPRVAKALEEIEHPPVDKE